MARVIGWAGRATAVQPQGGESRWRLPVRAVACVRCRVAVKPAVVVWVGSWPSCEGCADAAGVS